MFTKHIARTNFNLTTMRFILFPDEAMKARIVFELCSQKILFHSFNKYLKLHSVSRVWGIQ